ncbi:MAG: DUF123 domain-containing protein [Salinirussus sp.]
MSGVYSLVVRLDAAVAISVGALGHRRLPAGGYAYIGSAQGAGGFTRLERHRSVAAGQLDTTHWHIDYLLSDPAASVAGDLRVPDVAAECRLAAAHNGMAIAGFGCSDCDCDSHLFHYPDVKRALNGARRARATFLQRETKR